jgi:thiol-disulfide isomerase/thioredoxin
VIQRVRFILGAAVLLGGIPVVARGDEPEETHSSPPPPAAKPSSEAAAKPQATKKPHVHGANGVVTIPEHKLVEWKIEVLDGPKFRLSAYRGKAVFVNVFATWCGPCRVEQPELVAFARAHPDETVVIGVDVKEEDNDVRKYRKEFDIPYPIAMDRYDKRVRQIYREGRMVFPTTVVFRPDGTLACAWAGNVHRARFELEREYALGISD